VNLSDICSIAAFFCYMVATWTILSRLFHPQGPNLKLVLIFASVGMFTHLSSNLLFLFTQHDINFSLPNVVSLVSLVITLVISIAALRYKINLLLPVVYGFSGGWQLIMLLIPPISQSSLLSEHLGVVSHISLALIAYSILVIAALYTFQVTYINWKLKTKNLNAVSHLPPLMQVEKQLFNILFVGTCILFISQVTGFLFLDGFISKEYAHKTILSLLALCLYIAILWGHYKKGWRGHKVLALTILATGLLTLAYFGSRLVREVLLN
jgi:ABC-type uncharacterized transport system permease subunit